MLSTGKATREALHEHRVEALSCCDHVGELKSSQSWTDEFRSNEINFDSRKEEQQKDMRASH
jgi:hypothetical protein